MKYIIEYLKESLHNHINSEINNNYKFYEKLGIPEFVEKSTNIIFEYISKYVDKIKSLPNSKKFNIDNTIIIVNFENNSNIVDASYDFKNTGYENSTIIINVNIYRENKFFILDNSNNIESIIQHKMLHAYEDLSRYNKGQKLFGDLINDSYTKSFYYVNWPKNKYNNIVSNIIYFLNDEERNAYFSQLKKDIENSIEKLNMNSSNFDYDKLIEYVKDKPLWKRYFEIGIFIEQLINNKLQGYYKEFVYKEYNNINNSNLSEHRINKDIVNKWKKFKNKFEQLVPKIICNSLPYENKAR